ncbi:tRNA (adenosine(37)-N6)-threonylcarbamoyltransferase complex dimerization subunit type 1 TsaB [Sphingoaurantiacus capsulatus]|uniref:tRNA (Adenosine(37)-N6)-threonylcarbamoyltransferase complex dimerization subunit type 1 TsaB n=1 Tax=Sphingoaurantiacus capsulatus TaxID=1771310 RepID=A0ABV7XA92_9SPHN
MELAIETALHACSAALIDRGRIVAERHEIIARGHAERLVPLIAELLAEAGVTRANRIAVDVGPGSFTGIRVGLAAARAFGLAWKAPVDGFTSTALVAAGVFADHPDIDRLYVAFDASRGEVYAQAFDRDGRAGPLDALAPDAAAAAAPGRTVAGSGAALLSAVDPSLAVIDHPWPRAADARHLPAAARGEAARPLYIRAPDAKVPA